MPTGIEEAAATALVKRGVATVGNSAIRWLSLGPRERLFRLLFVEFGDSVAMPKDEFYAFATDEELSSLTDDLLAGRRPADDATAGLIAERIETRLHRVPEADRDAMASEIGTFAVFSYTAALKTPEELGHNIAAKVDMYGTQTTAALTDIQAELKRLVGAGDKETDLVAALMSSPLEHAGQTETVAAAQKLAGDGKHSEAATRFLEVADGLDAAGLVSVSETYRLLAAEQFRASGDIEEAVATVATAASTRANRGSADAWLIAGRIGHVGGPAWLGDAFSAYADWPRQPWAAQRLRDAWSQDDDPERRQRWLAALVQISAVSGDRDQVLQEIPALTPRASGSRLYWELDRIDAIEATQGATAADSNWDTVEH
jgi:hypothetical protein